MLPGHITHLYERAGKMSKIYNELTIYDVFRLHSRNMLMSSSLVLAEAPCGKARLDALMQEIARMVVSNARCKIIISSEDISNMLTTYFH